MGDIKVMVDGGKANAGPPLGPALAPLGVNIGNVVAKINEKTAAFSGMKVPVTVTINSDKSFDINIHGHFHGSPERYKKVFDKFYCQKHIEVSLENTNYKPVILKEIVDNYKPKKKFFNLFKN